MSECQLVLTEIRQKSKVRLFWLFKPNECVYWEPFDLFLSFKNVSNVKFEGGKCSFYIWGENTHRTAEVKLPSIEPNQVLTVMMLDVIIREIGYTFLTHIQVRTEDGKKVLCLDTKGEDTDRAEGAYPLHLATKEELYQKYAVVVALFFSVLASILTIVNVLVAIFW